MREEDCRTQHLPAVSSGSVRDRRCASRHTSTSLTFFPRNSLSLLAPHLLSSPLPLHFPPLCHTYVSISPISFPHFSPFNLFSFTHLFRSVLTITSLPSLISNPQHVSLFPLSNCFLVRSFLSRPDSSFFLISSSRNRLPRNFPFPGAPGTRCLPSYYPKLFPSFLPHLSYFPSFLSVSVVLLYSLRLSRHPFSILSFTIFHFFSNLSSPVLSIIPQVTYFSHSLSSNSFLSLTPSSSYGDSLFYSCTLFPFSVPRILLLAQHKFQNPSTLLSSFPQLPPLSLFFIYTNSASHSPVYILIHSPSVPHFLHSYSFFHSDSTSITPSM